MAGTLKTPKKGKIFRFAINLPGEMVIKIDEKLAALEAINEIPARPLTRTDVVRRAIWEFVK